MVLTLAKATMGLVGWSGQSHMAGLQFGGGIQPR